MSNFENVKDIIAIVAAPLSVIAGGLFAARASAKQVEASNDDRARERDHAEKVRAGGVGDGDSDRPVGVVAEPTRNPFRGQNESPRGGGGLSGFVVHERDCASWVGARTRSPRVR
ncbi:hypothetical protein [Nocardioides dongkuii]|uniref:hypothetical protein n=1 Tax=Nocardioides dongkuii TaxID=2760089 RepID=UPI0015FC74A3|nr:hypothetical protein [Nocardioides dongkuii]